MCRNCIVFSIQVAPGKFQKQSPSSCAAKLWVYIEQLKDMYNRKKGTSLLRGICSETTFIQIPERE